MASESRHTQRGLRDAGTAILASEIDSAESYVTGDFPRRQRFDDNYRFRHATRGSNALGLNVRFGDPTYIRFEWAFP